MKVTNALLLFVFFTAAVVHLLSAAEIRPYQRLPLFAQRDFLEYYRRSFILGERTEKLSFGAALQQHENLQKLLDFESLDSDDRSTSKLASEKLKKRLLEQSLYLDQSLVDWSYDFRNQFSSKAEKISSTYERLIENLPSQIKDSKNDEKIYNSILERLSIDIELKLLDLRFPLFLKYSPAQGLRGNILDQFLKSYPETFLKNIPEKILIKIRRGEALEFDEFIIYLEKSSSAHDPKSQILLFSRYLALGSLSFDLIADLPKKSEFLNRFETAVDICLKIAKEKGISFSPEDLNFTSALKETAYLTYIASQSTPWRPDWDKSWLSTRNFEAPIAGLKWAFLKYQNELNQPDLDFSKLPFSKSVENAQLAIDEWVRKNIPEQNLEYHTARIQLSDGSFRNLGRKKFAYYRLNDELRNLFLARNLPDLSLREAQALVELKFFELSEEERLNTLQKIYPDVQLLFSYFQKLAVLDLNNPDSLELFQLDLIETYFNLRSWNNVAKLIKNPKPQKILYNKEIVSDLSNEKSQLEYSIAHSPREDSLYPDSLINWLSINLFSSEEFWSEELKRFSSEWRRRSDEKKLRTKIIELENKYKLAPTKEEKSIAATEIEEALKQNSAIFDLERTEPSSPSVFMANFLSGMTPQNLREAQEIGVNLGIGAIFYVVGRFVGAKWLSIFILSDTGLRLISAEILSPQKANLLGVDLSKGISTPLGKWTAEFLFHLAKTAETALTADRGFNKLNSIRDLGAISRDIASASIGAGISHLSLDLSRLSRMRTIHTYQIQIEKYQTKIAELRSEILKLDSELNLLLRQKSLLEKTFEPTSKELRKIESDILKTQLGIAQIENGLLAQFQSKLEFTLKRFAIETIRLGSGILMPRKSKLAERVNPKQYFGISTYEQMIKSLESKIRAEEINGFVTESSSLLPAPWKRVILKRSLSKFLKSQNEIATHLVESTNHLDAAIHASREKKINYFESSLESLQKAYEAMTKHSRNTEGVEYLTSGSIKDFTQLAEYSKPTATLSRIQTWALSIEEKKLILNAFIRRKSLLDVEKYPWEYTGDIHTLRFFSENYINLEMQLKALNHTYAQIEAEIIRTGINLSPTMRNLFESIAKISSQTESALLQLRPILDKFLK